MLTRDGILEGGAGVWRVHTPTSTSAAPFIPACSRGAPESVKPPHGTSVPPWLLPAHRTVLRGSWNFISVEYVPSSSKNFARHVEGARKGSVALRIGAPGVAPHPYATAVSPTPVYSLTPLGGRTGNRVEEPVTTPGAIRRTRATSLEPGDEARKHGCKYVDAT